VSNSVISAPPLHADFLYFVTIAFYLKKLFSLTV